MHINGGQSFLSGRPIGIRALRLCARNNGVFIESAPVGLSWDQEGSWLASRYGPSGLCTAVGMGPHMNRG